MALKQFPHNRFQIKDLDNSKYFLGLKVATSSNGLNLTQRKYTFHLFKGYGLLDSKQAKVFLDHTINLHKDNGAHLLDITLIQGSLLRCYTCLALIQIYLL